jgi:hypothetical protein
LSLVIESSDLSELYEQLGPVVSKLGVADAARSIGDADEQSLALEADGADDRLTLIDWLQEVVALRRDYGFLIQSVEVVRLLPTRVGAHVFGAYVTDLEPSNLAVQLDDLTLDRVGDLWRVTIDLPS